MQLFVRLHSIRHTKPVLGLWRMAPSHRRICESSAVQSMCCSVTGATLKALRSVETVIPEQFGRGSRRIIAKADARVIQHSVMTLTAPRNKAPCQEKPPCFDRAREFYFYFAAPSNLHRVSSKAMDITKALAFVST